MRLAIGRVALVVVLVGAALPMLGVFPTPFQAQSIGISVAIPFDFHVGGKTLPSGTYSVYRVGEAIQISDAKGHSVYVVSTAVPNPASKLDSQIVFDRYGDECYLSEVRWNGYSAGRVLIKTANEIELAKTFSGRSVLSAGLTR